MPTQTLSPAINSLLNRAARAQFNLTMQEVRQNPNIGKDRTITYWATDRQHLTNLIADLAAELRKERG
jgi:hypothetical protein